MQVTKQLAKHFRELYSGGNWTSVNLKETLAGVTWQEATTAVHSWNPIALLVYHTGYYVRAVARVLEGGPLDAKDRYSFDLPPIRSSEDWEGLLEETWAHADRFARLVEELPDSRLEETFSEEKYGNYFRNILGVIEHTHYHLGQIVLVKKLLSREAEHRTKGEAT